MTYDTLILDRSGPHVLIVRMNRPDVLNALNTRMADELASAFALVPGDVPGDSPADFRVVILTGAGDRAFCAGADLKERRDMAEDAWRVQHRVFERAATAVAAAPIPVIAAVNGAALGGGCELALACDLIVAADTASFGQPEVTRGLMPGLGGTQRLARRIGIARAKELLFTGRAIDAHEAVAWGLANRVVPAAALADTALQIAQTIAANAPIAVRHIKVAVDEGADRPLVQALGAELAHYDATMGTGDRREGIDAFNDKRPPVFRNR